MELRIAIVEDQEPEARRLELLLRRAFQGDEPICTRFSSGDDLLARFTTGAYEVVFLDICMAGTNGIETARQLREKDPRLLIVFVTSSPEYVWDAFPVHPFDYLLKPYKEEKIALLTAELRRVLCRQEPELDVRIARQTMQIPLSKVHYAAFLIFCMPRDSAIILINRIMIIAVLAVSISLLGIFLLLYEMYRVAMEYTRNTRLDRENQLLAVESRRYMELRAYMDQTRSLRHDFRQHLHVISGLTEAGELEELKSYLRQYEDELNDARPTLCANPAVDALAGHYDSDARQKGIPVEWKLELPKRLPLPEADLCTLLGNLLENAVFASQKLPPDERQVRVMARMLSPAMLGIVVENRYDGVLKKQKGVLHSTKHEGQGIGLVSIHTTVQKYHGNLTVETENNVFRANVLLNL